jgi:hypothetical protein
MMVRNGPGNGHAPGPGRDPLDPLARLTLALRTRDAGSGSRPHRSVPRDAPPPSRAPRRIGPGLYMTTCNLACSSPKYPTVLLWSFFPSSTYSMPQGCNFGGRGGPGRPRFSRRNPFRMWRIRFFEPRKDFPAVRAAPFGGGGGLDHRSRWYGPRAARLRLAFWRLVWARPGRNRRRFGGGEGGGQDVRHSSVQRSTPRKSPRAAPWNDLDGPLC